MTSATIKGGAPAPPDLAELRRLRGRLRAAVDRGERDLEVVLHVVEEQLLEELARERRDREVTSR
jgi:hypothetical protein